jgi:hypothetical protein
MKKKFLAFMLILTTLPHTLLSSYQRDPLHPFDKPMQAGYDAITLDYAMLNSKFGEYLQKNEQVLPHFLEVTFLGYGNTTMPVTAESLEQNHARLVSALSMKIFNENPYLSEAPVEYCASLTKRIQDTVSYFLSQNTPTPSDFLQAGFQKNLKK